MPYLNDTTFPHNDVATGPDLEFIEPVLIVSRDVDHAAHIVFLGTKAGETMTLRMMRTIWRLGLIRYLI